MDRSDYMEKNEFGSILVYLIMLALIYLVGQTVIVFALKGIDVTVNQALYIFICAVISIVTFTLFFEVGHIVGAKIGNYKCVYFNFFGLCFYRAGGKWQFKFEGFDGLFSETRFAPKNIEKKSNPAHFLRGGLVAFLISIAVGLVIFSLGALPATVRYGTLIYFGVGLVFMLYNIIPMKTDILNDGYRLKLLGSKENAEAYNDFMRIENDARLGITTEEFKVYESITPMTVLINDYAYYSKLANHEYEEAEKIIDIILKDTSNLSAEKAYRYRFEKLFFVILNKTKEEASDYYWKEMSSYDRKALAKDNYISSRRVYLLVSGIINESIYESQIAIEGMKKRINKMVDKTKRQVELELYEKCIHLVMENIKNEDLISFF